MTSVIAWQYGILSFQTSEILNISVLLRESEEESYRGPQRMFFEKHDILLWTFC